MGQEQQDKGERWGSQGTESVDRSSSPEATCSLAQALSPLLLLQVGSHLGLPEAFQVIEARGQVPGHLVGADTISQLVSSLWPLAFLRGLRLGHGALGKPAKVQQCPQTTTWGGQGQASLQVSHGRGAQQGSCSAGGSSWTRASAGTWPGLTWAPGGSREVAYLAGLEPRLAPSTISGKPRGCSEPSSPQGAGAAL